MNCQQKSGVFLNIHCSNTKKNKCSNCKKDVCETHTHTLESKVFCEDCYWERFLYTIETTEYYDSDTFIDNTTNTTSNASSLSSNTDNGFSGGFGGGSFGGGGASAEWTEGDMESLNENNTAAGFLTDTDDTFFYS